MCLSGRPHPAAVVAPRPATQLRPVQQLARVSSSLKNRDVILASAYEYARRALNLPNLSPNNRFPRADV